MNAGNDVLFVFQRGFFGGNKAENDLLFADVAQRFKAACAVTVILQEETIYIAVTEQGSLLLARIRRRRTRWNGSCRGRCAW